MCVCPMQEMYSDDRRVWNAMFEILSKDLAEAETKGIDLGGQDGILYPIILGNKGDWSYLVYGRSLAICFDFCEVSICSMSVKGITCLILEIKVFTSVFVIYISLGQQKSA